MSISVGTYVLVDGSRRALVQCEGDILGSWDVCFDDNNDEELVESSRLVVHEHQRVKPSDAELVTEERNFLKARMDKKPVGAFSAYGRTVAQNLRGLDEIWRDNATGGRVFVGNVNASQSRSTLEQSGVTHVVNCTADLPNHFERAGVAYLRFDRIDFLRHDFGGSPGGALEPSILAFFAPLFEFVDAATATGASVLIHCIAGAHRAGTSGCAYLMHRERGLSASEAVTYCKVRRPVIDPEIDDDLMRLLQRLQCAHRGEAAPPAVGSSRPALPGEWAEPHRSRIDLNAEGRRILAAGPEPDTQPPPQDWDRDYEAGD